MIEPKNFLDILKLQEIHEVEVNKPREDGFIARPKKYADIRGALMDEFMEFRRELPYNLNFKTWKKKRYSAAKQLEEFVDMLFFIATEINFSSVKMAACDEWEYYWECYKTNAGIDESDLHFFMRNICEESILELIHKYVILAKRIGYTEKDILQQYWKKWQYNLKDRIEGDWSHEKN